MNTRMYINIYIAEFKNINASNTRNSKPWINNSGVKLQCTLFRNKTKLDFLDDNSLEKI